MPSSARPVCPAASLQIKTQHRWMQRFSVRCGRDERLMLIIFYPSALIECAVFTFVVVVEDTVVSAGFRVSVPERSSTEAERGKLHVDLRQSLLQPSLQSLDEPPEEKTRQGRCKPPKHQHVRSSGKVFFFKTYYIICNRNVCLCCLLRYLIICTLRPSWAISYNVQFVE